MERNSEMAPFDLWRKEKQYLLNNGWAVFTHPLHDVNSFLLPRCTGRFGRDSQGIDQSLWMMFSDVSEKISYIPPDIGTWRLNTSNDLRKQNEYAENARRHMSYLWDDVQPSIDFNAAEPTGHSVADFVMGTKLEPECK